MCVVLLLLAGAHTQAQREETEFVRLSLTTNVGYRVASNPLKLGKITDNLIGFDESNVYWQYVNMDYFLNRHLGLGLTVQGDFFAHPNTGNELINKELAEVYGSQYFVSSSYSDLIAQRNSGYGFYCGVTYRVFVGKFTLVPKLHLGLTGYDLNRLTVYLKEKNTNTRVSQFYETDNGDDYDENFSVLGSLSLEYRVGRKTKINFLLQSTGFESDFGYTIETKDAFTGRSTVEEIDYRRWINTYAVGLGFGLEFQ